MGHCFCDKAPRAKTASGDEPPSVPALPAVLPPARLATPRAELPETVTSSSNTASRVSRGRGSQPAAIHSPSRIPVPKVKGLGGLSGAEMDSDEKPPALSSHKSASALRTGSLMTTDGKLTTENLGDGHSRASSSSLGSLVNRIGSLHRTPSAESNRCRAIETESEKEDYAVAARRAEVRRLTHKTIQDELHQEQHSQLPRSYKSTTMTTINEDPADGPASSSATTVVVGGSARAALGSDGPPGDHIESSVVAPDSHGKSPFLAKRGPAVPPATSSFTLRSKSTDDAVLPRGLLGFRRFHGAHTKQVKSWKWSSLVASPSQRKSQEYGESPAADMPTLPAATPHNKENFSYLGTQEKKPALDYCDTNQFALAGSGPKEESDNALNRRHLFAPLSDNIRTAHFRTISESLSSVDKDGSIHEAREAQVVLRRKPGGCSNSEDATSAAPGNPSPRLLGVLHAAAGGGTIHMRRPSRVSEKSHISVLDLPPPMVEENASGSGRCIPQQDAVKGLVTPCSPPMDEKAVTGLPSDDKDTASVLANRKALAPLQIFSRKGREILKAKKSADMQVSASSIALPSQDEKFDALTIRALEVRPKTLLSEIGINVKQISRAPLDSRFRSAEDHKPEGHVQATGEQPDAQVVEKFTDLVDRSEKRMHTSSALALDKMAEEWHRQIKQLHIESLESQQQHTRDLAKRMQGKSKRFMSHTCPPAFQSSASSIFRDVFGDDPQGPWQVDTLSLSDRPRAQRLLPPGLHANSTTLPNRSRGEFLAGTHLPESWWNQSVNTSAQDVYGFSAKSTTGDDNTTPATPVATTGISSEDDENGLQNNGPNSVAEPPGVIPTKFEKTVIGLQRLLSWKQISNSPAQPAMPAKPAMPSKLANPTEPANYNSQCVIIAPHTTEHPQICETSISSCVEDVPQPPSSQEVDTKLEAQEETGGQQGKHAAESQSDKGSHRQSTDDLEDIDSVIRVLIDTESNQNKGVVLSGSQHQDLDSEDITAARNKPTTAQLTAPSTPVMEAYAEVRAYIAKTFVENRASHVAKRISSCSTEDFFCDAVAHQGGGEEQSKHSSEERTKQANDGLGTPGAPWWVLATMTTPVSKG